jgi:hypothetical protein
MMIRAVNEKRNPIKLSNINISYLNVGSTLRHSFDRLALALIKLIDLGESMVGL